MLAAVRGVEVDGVRRLCIGARSSLQSGLENEIPASSRCVTNHVTLAVRLGTVEHRLVRGDITRKAFVWWPRSIPAKEAVDDVTPVAPPLRLTHQ